MKFDSLLIHFGELSTKGENKKMFINCLYRNIKVALDNPNITYKKDRDHIVLNLNGEEPEKIIKRLQDISGIHRISPIYRGSRDMNELKEQALGLIKNVKGSTFKIETKRGDKRYPLNSYQICCEVADHILDNTELTVDLHEPDITLHLDVRDDCVYISCATYLGCGGYPLGMNGKVMMFLSGGIDSPVAAYSMLRRGVKIECLHFAAPPYTSQAVIYKLEDIIAKLGVYQPEIKLHIVPFTKLQEDIYKYCDESYAITIMRRMMMRIGTLAAKRYRCLAIATGESIGQVASQTLQSMQVINEVTNFPVVRPLAASDKLEIIDTAKRIGTFDISIRPYEDCCTIFKPKAPKTKPHLGECYFYEKQWDFESEVKDCVEGIETIVFKKGKRVE
ncbi:MAG: tRNA 4-thiouridine(8) synthase ThiI [Bacilli bacterium]|nr:tRNA 4-thiouridine(8) synthase ThiI [Bacilli bacterium]